MKNNKFNGFAPPVENWFRVPNSLIDMLPSLSGGELTVLLYILRHTWGFNDEQKRITIDEFCNGRKRGDGSRMDNGTGLSKQTIIKSVKSLCDKGLIDVEVDDTDRARIKKFYSVKITNTEDTQMHTNKRRPLQHKVKFKPPMPTQSKFYVDIVAEPPKELIYAQTDNEHLSGEYKNCTSDVQKLNIGCIKTIQRTEKDTIEIHQGGDTENKKLTSIAVDENKTAANAAETQNASPHKIKPKHKRNVSEAVRVYREIAGYNPIKSVRDEISETVKNIDLWRRVVKAWVMMGWNNRNVGGMLDYYKRGEVPNSGKGKQPIQTKSTVRTAKDVIQLLGL